MSLIYPNRYPGRWDPTSAQYPQGKFKNRSSPTAKDGSFCEMDWANDWAGFFGAILKNAGVTPNGSVDTATASQLYDALRLLMLGILPKRTFATNDFIRIPDVPGGLIVQWGTYQLNGNTATIDAASTVGTCTLPVQFPSVHLASIPVGYGESSTFGESIENFVSVGNKTLSGSTIVATRVAGKYGPVPETLGIILLSVGF